jgi:hypothetical protein
MIRATPLRLDDNDRALHTLRREYPRGRFIEPHAHAWVQVLYAIEGMMRGEVGNEAVVVPPQRAVWLYDECSAMRNLYL